MVTKTEILNKFSSKQLKEIAICEKIKVQKGIRKKGLVEKLLPISLTKIKKYAQEYSVTTTKTSRKEQKNKENFWRKVLD